MIILKNAKSGINFNDFFFAEVRENNWFISYLYKKTKKKAISCYQFYIIGFNVYDMKVFLF